MKNLILALALCLVATPSLARDGNDGPNAAQEARSAPKIIAQVSIGAMFVPHDHPKGESVSVKDNGDVEHTLYWFNGKTKVKIIAKLSNATLAKLKANVNAVSKGEVVDPNPELPGCMDAPTTTYLANTNGVLLAIEQRIDCKDFRKTDANEADAAVVKTLKALMDLAELRAPGKY